MLVYATPPERIDLDGFHLRRVADGDGRSAGLRRAAE
jgi:hypothetical protein